MHDTKNKCLITGITGMVGSHLADYLLANTDWEIHGLCRWRSPIDNISHLSDQINEKNRIFLHHADLRDSLSIDKIIKSIKPEYVFHLAAQSFPKVSFDAPIETYDTNIIGTERLLSALKTHKKDSKIHICASSEVLGCVPRDKLPIDEECQFDPASPYAISKIGTDLIGRHYAKAYDMCIMTTRMFTHTGPRRGDVFAESTFAKQIAMIEAGLIDPIVMTGNLDSLRTWADVRDAVRAYFMLVTKNPVKGEYYNIGGTHVLSVRDMLNYLIKLSTNKDIAVQTDPDRLRPIDADLQIPDTTKFYNHTGWKPEISFNKTMTDLLNYWREKISKTGSYLQR